MLASLTIPHPWRDLTDALTESSCCWLNNRRGLIGLGEIATFTSTGPNRIPDGDQWWQELLQHAHIENHVDAFGTGPLAFGYFSFSPTSRYPSRLVAPRIILGQNENHSWLTLLSLEPDEKLSRTLALQELQRLSDEQDPDTSISAPLTPSWETDSLTEEGWMDIVARATDIMRSSSLEKVVLARSVTATVAQPLSRRRVIRHLSHALPESWSYGVGELVGATPELLARVRAEHVHTRVLAGTARKQDFTQQPPADLLSSPKERREHALAVQSVTEQLTPLATEPPQVHGMYPLELPYLWHLASDVTARLPAQQARSLVVLEHLHPTAAVCGYPRASAHALIEEWENMDRGPYAGPVGWMDATGEGEWGIALRGGLIRGRRAHLFAGAGIVERSTPSAELDETQMKLQPMQQALGFSPHQPARRAPRTHNLSRAHDMTDEALSAFCSYKGTFGR